MKSIAVIDLAIVTLTLYDIPEEWDNEKIEEFIVLKNHRLSECSWGVFEDLIDERN